MLLQRLHKSIWHSLFASLQTNDSKVVWGDLDCQSWHVFETDNWLIIIKWVVKSGKIRFQEQRHHCIWSSSSLTYSLHAGELSLFHASTRMEEWNNAHWSLVLFSSASSGSAGGCSTFHHYADGFGQSGGDGSSSRRENNRNKHFKSFHFLITSTYVIFSLFFEPELDLNLI